MLASIERFGPLEILVIATGALCVTISLLLPERFIGLYLLLFFSCSASLVVVELALQSLLGSRYYTAYQFDPDYLFKPRPRTESVYQHLPVNGGDLVVSRFNGHGFRGPELKISTGTPRIVVYGDSFIQAEFTPIDETFVAQLQLRLTANLNKDIEVINAGVAGYGPDQILRRMKSDLETLKPALVVVSVFSGNDFGDLVRNQLYRLDEQGGLAKNDFRISKSQLRSIEISHAQPVLRILFRKALQSLRQERMASVTFDRHRAIEWALEEHLREYEQSVVGGDNTVGNFGVDPYSADVSLLPDSPSAIYKIRLMSLIVLRLRQIAEKYGVEIMLMIIPHPMDLLNGDHESGWVDKKRYPQYNPSRLTDTVVAIAEMHRVKYLNLYPNFRRADPRTLYLKGGDDHWNAAGQALAAELAAKFIVDRKYIH